MPLRLLDRLATASIAAAVILFLAMCTLTAAFRLPFPVLEIVGEAVVIVAGIAAGYAVLCFGWVYFKS